MSQATASVKVASGGSAVGPFRHRAFAVLWAATVISNIGTWMNDVGASWLMTSLAPSPLMVSLVQAATALPIFLFALPAGAPAAIVDRRKLLLGVSGGMAVVAPPMRRSGGGARRHRGPAQASSGGLRSYGGRGTAHGPDGGGRGDDPVAAAALHLHSGSGSRPRGAKLAGDRA